MPVQAIPVHDETEPSVRFVAAWLAHTIHAAKPTVFAETRRVSGTPILLAFVVGVD
jgi:hypothetical protein